VRFALAPICCTALLLASAASGEAVGANRPRVAISVSPAQLAVPVPGSSKLTVRNDGAERVAVGVTRRSVDPSTKASAWLQVVPGRLVLRSGASATLTVRVKRPRQAEPGTHRALVLLTTREVRSGRVNVQMRLGVRIRMRVPGPILRHIAFGALHVHRARETLRMFLSVANRGTVTVQLQGRVTALLVQRGEQVARLSPRGRRALLPGTRAVLTLRYGGRVRGLVAAVVRVRLGPGIHSAEHRYRLRL
jgi:hypothetical protein